MAAETVNQTLDTQIRSTFGSLEAEKNATASCIRQYKTLSDHYSSIFKTLDSLSESLDSKIHVIDSRTEDSLRALGLRENEIPNIESKNAELVELRKQDAIKEMEDETFDVKGDFLGMYCRRMDSKNLWRYLLNAKCKVDELRNAFLNCVDSCRLVIDAVCDFLSNEKVDESMSEKFWVIGMLVRALFDLEGHKRPEISSTVKNRAEEVLSEWEVGDIAGEEAEVFLRSVVCFGLNESFDEDDLRKMVLANASKEGMEKIAAGLMLGEKIEGIIEELVKYGKGIEAASFACECGLTDKFPPVPLIRNYLQVSKEEAHSIMKNGNNSAAAIEESTKLEMNYTRAIIKCVEKYGLKSEFNIENLKRRLSSLEKSKEEKKRKATPGGATNSQHKKQRPDARRRYRPPKAVRVANRQRSHNRPSYSNR